MDSRPADADRANETETETRPTFAAARPMPVRLGAMHRVVRIARPQLGLLARRTSVFGRMVGLSGAARQAMRPSSGPSLGVVRMPEGLWPNEQAHDPAAALIAADPGIAAIARLYARPTRRTAAADVHRGLPATTRRAARTSIGAMTGPSALARRIQPSETRIRRNESHGATTPVAGSRPQAPAARAQPTSARPLAPAPGRRLTPAATTQAPGFGSRALLRAVATYADASTPDAKAAAFAAAMGLAAPASAESNFRPPSAGSTTASRAVAPRPGGALWAAAAGRSDGFGGDPTGDSVADGADGGPGGASDTADRHGDDDDGGGPGGVSPRGAVRRPVAGDADRTRSAATSPPSSPSLSAPRSSSSEPSSSSTASSSTSPASSTSPGSSPAPSRRIGQRQRPTRFGPEAGATSAGGGVATLHRGGLPTAHRVAAFPSVLSTSPARGEMHRATFEPTASPALGVSRVDAAQLTVAGPAASLSPNERGLAAAGPTGRARASVEPTPTALGAIQPTQAGSDRSAGNTHAEMSPAAAGMRRRWTLGELAVRPGVFRAAATGARIDVANDAGDAAVGRTATPGLAAGPGNDVGALVVTLPANLAAGAPSNEAPRFGQWRPALGADRLPAAMRARLTAALSAASTPAGVGFPLGDQHLPATPPVATPPVARPPAATGAAAGFASTAPFARGVTPAAGTAIVRRVPAPRRTADPVDTAVPRARAVSSAAVRSPRAAARVAMARPIAGSSALPAATTTLSLAAGRNEISLPVPGDASARFGAGRPTAGSSTYPTSDGLEGLRRATDPGWVAPPTAPVLPPSRSVSAPPNVAGTDSLPVGVDARLGAGHRAMVVHRAVPATSLRERASGVRTAGAVPRSVAATPTSLGAAQVADTTSTSLSAAALAMRLMSPTSPETAARSDDDRTLAVPRSAPRLDLPPVVAPAPGTHRHTVAMQERFLDVLRAAPAQRPVALPDRFRPLARGLSKRPVLIAHGRASQAALRAVNRPAATLGNVVHLQRAPDSTAVTTELLAHELVHAASAPARPRFFAEPGHDHEEHRARRVGRLARATQSATGTQPVSRVHDAAVLPRVIQRTEAGAAPALRSGGSDGGGSGTETIRRVIGAHRGGANGAAPPVDPRPPAVQQPAQDGSSDSSVPAQQADDDVDSVITSRRTRRSTTEVLNEFEELIDMIEERVINDLERRGGRVRGWW